MSTQFSLSFGPPARTVTQITAAIRESLQSEFRGVWIEGEITETKMAPSGHWYFSLKDANAKIKCACYKSQAWRLKVKPRDGLAVVARGSIDVYEPRGEYQFIVEALQPRGFGELQLAFEELKKKLAAEGLFDAERKRPLPERPRRIGIVTSPAGAVIQDLLHVFERRSPGLHLRVYPALVQGMGSIEQVCAGIEYFSQSGWADLVIVARGGGSLEDLWTFNEEAVARAIAESTIPVVSAIGHETDFTIADFVADLRAPTPSAAAEMVAPNVADLIARLRDGEDRLSQRMRFLLSRASERLHRQGIDRARAIVERRIARAQQRTDELDFQMRAAIERILRAGRERHAIAEARLTRTDIRLRFRDAHRRLDQADSQMGEAMRRRLLRARARWESLDAQLGHLSPVAILERGYAIVQNADGAVLADASKVTNEEELQVRLARGRLTVRVSTRSEESGPRQ